jgi:hypothetical protein
MNEYESALHAALMELVKAIAKGETDKLAQKFRSAAQTCAEQGYADGAATLKMLADVAEGDPAYIPRPSFEIIQGGESEPGNSSQDTTAAGVVSKLWETDIVKVPEESAVVFRRTNSIGSDK